MKINEPVNEMGVKSFSISDELYEKYSSECKRLGLNMSKQIENFMKFQLEEEFAVREEYIEKIRKIRNEKFKPVADFDKHFDISESGDEEPLNRSDAIKYYKGLKEST